VQYNAINIHTNVTELFPTVYLTENTKRYYKIHPVLLPIRTVATTVKAVCKRCRRVFGCYSNLRSQYFFISISYLGFEVLTSVVAMSSIFSVQKSRSPFKVNRRFGRTYHFHLQGGRNAEQETSVKTGGTQSCLRGGADKFLAL
jgi:hypothetical protein